MKEINSWFILSTAFLNSNKYTKLILKNKKLNEHIIRSNLIILICTLIYGAITGFFLGGTQILINAIKIPLIVFSLLYISLPIFFVFNIFNNKGINIKQITMALLSGFTITALIMIAFAPVNLLFSITTANVNFIVLLNTSIGVMAILCGLFYIYKIFHNISQNGNEYVSLIMGYFIIIFSAPQLLWALRPYFHHIDGFIEPIKSNFYVEILKVAGAEPLLTAVFVLIFSLVGILIIYNLTEEQYSNVSDMKEQKQENNRKKRSIKRIKEIPHVEVIANSNSKLPSYNNQKEHYPKYPYYPYPYYYNPYPYRQTQNNVNQK